MKGQIPPQTDQPTDVFPGNSGAPPPPHSVSVYPDELLLEGQRMDIYDCDRLLGRGGMGVVYLARNTALHRQCALKLLSPRRLSADVDYIRRFQQEARAAAALVHPHIVTTYAAGTFQDRHYLEMEYVAGHSLQKELDRRGPMEPLRATRIAAGIADGLAAAHRLGIIHRDLKPDNVLLTPSGNPKIGDFGLAKRIHAADTRSQPLAGTPHYMAPEIFEGGPVSKASDMFALGVCYYLMLTGRPPFEADSLTGLMHRILAGQYVPVREIRPEVPLDIAECVSMLLARSADNRPADGTAGSQLLQSVLGSTQDLEMLVRDAFRDVNQAAIRPAADGFEVRLTLPDGRAQSVRVTTSDHRPGQRLLLIYSICCRAEKTFYERALRLNAAVLHGGLSIRDIDGEPCFVMIDTYPRGTVEAEEIRRSVVEVGFQADRIEQELTGRDIH